MSDYLELIHLLSDFLPVPSDEVRLLVEKMGEKDALLVDAAYAYDYQTGYDKKQTTPEKFLESYKRGVV